MTNTWFDLDSPSREVSALYRKKLGCSYKDPEVYKALARRAVDPRDSFRMVVKVSCVATHVEKLQKVQDWWPKLWRLFWWLQLFRVMERFPLAEADVEGPLNGAKDEGPAESADKVVKVEFQSRSQLSKVLQSHRGEQLVITTSDVMEMMADLKRTSRVAVLQGALSSWFACATGLSVLEVDCNEQRQPMEGDVGSHVVFRIRLNAVYEVEVAKVPKVEDLCAMYRQKLIQVLPKEKLSTDSYRKDEYGQRIRKRCDCIYQIQNMRLAQWGLFREDVRDVFTLSQTNMDNYILVGALIVTAVMNFIFVGYPAFPQEPRWLLLLWNNCVFACITFGLVSVWLALHGSIAQRSARVKILTQAVRPPVPSLKEIQEAMRAQENFEGGGARRYFEPPAFLVPMAEAQDEVQGGSCGLAQ
eukprot:symbB.v1.2.034506.t1/scaffold4469.1/size39292/1